MRVSLIIGLLGLSGCSAMATMQTDLESQPAVVSEKPQPSKPAPQKVNPITGQMAGESELDRALQRLVDDLELAVMRMPSGRYRGQSGGAEAVRGDGIRTRRRGSVVVPRQTLSHEEETEMTAGRESRAVKPRAVV